MGSISNLKSEDVVRTHMSYYLKNEATNWYDSELTSLEKEALRVLPLEQITYGSHSPIPAPPTKRLPVEETPRLLPPTPSTRIPVPYYPPTWPGGQSSQASTGRSPPEYGYHSSGLSRAVLGGIWSPIFGNHWGYPFMDGREQSHFR